MIRLFYYFIFIGFLLSCSEYNEGEPITPEVSPVNLDLDQIPYPRLSDYNFFTSPMRSQEPVYGVLPYEPINSLFTDYAHKNRFIWLPENAQITYVNDDEPFNFPDGSAVIKNFYYEHVQPQNAAKILETRIMIRKNGAWIFANYIWNDEQSEAFLDMSGRDVPLSWNENGNLKSTVYRIPSESECFTCHKLAETAILIGPKPRNLNADFMFSTGLQNQIEKWVEFGYLDENSLPASITTMPDWHNNQITTEERVRAYMDMNCAHCHSELAHCSYRPVRFAWNETEDESNMGVCETATEGIDGFEYIVQPGNHERSSIYYRFTTDDVAYRMPFLGRTLVHEDAAELFAEWINGMNYQNCQ